MPPSARATTALLERANAADLGGAVAAAVAAAAEAPTGESLNALGTALVRAGRKDIARAAYALAVDADPGLYKPRANLANLHAEQNELDEAIEHLRIATSLASDRGQLWASFGSVLQRAGRTEPAAAAYERAVELTPSSVLWHNLGLCRAASGRLGPALHAFREALRLDPDAFLPCFAAIEILNEVGSPADVLPLLAQAARTVPDDPDVLANVIRHFQVARFDAEAERLLRIALDKWPTHGTLLLLLSNVLARSDRLPEAEPYCERAIQLGADDPGVWLQLAKIRMRQQRLDEERAILEDAARRFPSAYEVRIQLATSLQHAERISEAEAILLGVVEETASADALCMLAWTQIAFGDAEAAMRLIRRADTDPPDRAFSASLAALISNYTGEAGQPGYRETIERWVGANLERPRVLEPLPRSLSPDRRLRIGYVSPDLRAHSVSRFMEPLLAEHDRRQVEVVCYSTTRNPHDDVTARIRALELEFHDMAHADAFTLARRVRDDGIDILIDVAGWTTEQRIDTFLARPAPIQVTYLGYPATLGVPEIEHRVTDAVADPPGVEGAYTERLIRLDRCAWAFRLRDEDVGSVPERPSRPITFGSFNNLSKVGTPTLDLFAEVLRRIPGSRLLLKAKQIDEARATDRLRSELGARGVDADRISLTPFRSSRVEHMQLYHEVDIGLDTYPYNGTTTTCEALWMGVPVVTLRGDAPASRVGHSLLTACGLGHLCAATPEEYARIAVDLATAPAPLADLKRGLRARVAASELGDCAGLARALERAYRSLWHQWVAAHG